jgi:hypothetical protein
MKITICFVAGLLLLAACGEGDDVATACRVSSAVLFDKSPTEFSFTPDAGGTPYLNSVSVYTGTDSSYVYNYSYSGGRISTITRLEDGASSTYTASYSGDLLSQLESATERIVFEHTGGRITKATFNLAATGGGFFPVGHTVYVYGSDGNLGNSNTRIDLVALLTIAFGGVPTGYAPVLVSSTDFLASNSPNPMNSFFFLDFMELTFMENLPSVITYKDASGSVTKTETYTITSNEHGYPTRAQAGGKYLEVTYVCN